MADFVEAKVLEQLRQAEADEAKLTAELVTKRTLIEVLRKIVNTDGPATAKQRPASAVKALIAQHPEGIACIEIANKLEHVIETSSDNPRRIIQNTVNQLATGGAIKLTERKGRKFASPKE